MSDNMTVLVLLQDYAAIIDKLRHENKELRGACYAMAGMLIAEGYSEDQLPDFEEH